MSYLTGKEAKAAFRKAGYKIYGSYASASRGAKGRGKVIIQQITREAWIIK